MHTSQTPYNRVLRPLANAAGYYSRLSGIYDWLAASEKRFIDQGIQVLDPRPGENILEIGFGTGYAQEKIISGIGDGLSAGIDIAGGMALTAKTRLQKAGLIQKSGLVLNNSLPLPFARDTFEGLFSSFTLELFDSPLIPKVLDEISRVLKSGGRLVCVSLSKDAPLPIMGRLYENIHKHFPQLLDCRPIPLNLLLQAAGFDVHQTTTTSMWGLPVTIADGRK